MNGIILDFRQEKRAGEWEEKSKKTKQDCQWLEKNRYFYWVEKTKCAKRNKSESIVGTID